MTKGSLARPKVDALDDSEANEVFTSAMDSIDTENLSDTYIRAPFYMKPFDEDPEDLSLWPPTPQRDLPLSKKPAALDSVNIFGWSKKRRTRNLILATSPLTKSNLFGRSLAAIALDPHDVAGDGNIDFKKRDQDGIPIVTLKEIHSEADPESVEFHSKGLWTDPNKRPGDPDVWPPPGLALALVNICASTIAQLPLDEIVPCEDIEEPVTPAYREPCTEEPPMLSPGSPCSVDSCPRTPPLVPDLSPTSTEPDTPASASIVNSFNSLRIEDNHSHNIEIVVSDAQDVPSSPGIISTSSSTVSPMTSVYLSPSSTISCASTPEAECPSSGPSSNRHRLENPLPSPSHAKPKNRRPPRSPPGTRFKAVVFSPSGSGHSSSTSSSHPANIQPTHLGVSSSSSGPSPHSTPSSPLPSPSSNVSSPGGGGQNTVGPHPHTAAGGRLPCMMCLQTFKNLSDFNRHMDRIHNPNNPGIKCPECFKTLSRMDAVQRHLNRKACGKRAALRRTLEINRLLGRT